MPVLMSYLPVPSRLMAAAMRVSLVARDTKARRPPLPGVVSIWVTVAPLDVALGAAFFLAAGRAIGSPLSWQPVHTGTRAARSSATRVRMTPKSTIRPAADDPPRSYGGGEGGGNQHRWPLPARAFGRHAAKRVPV